jgi:hypothetical protein
MATIAKMKTGLAQIIANVGFVILSAGASFVSRTSVAPPLLFEKGAALLPSDPRLSALFAILALAVLAGLIPGILVGLALGFFATSRPAVRAFWIGIGALAITMVWWFSIVKVGAAAQTWSMALEGLVLIGTLCVVSGMTYRLSQSISLKARMICGGVSVLLALLLLFSFYPAP